MLNAVDMDDYLGWFCSDEPYPLLGAINDQLTAPLPSTTPRPTTTTTTTPATTTLATTVLPPDIKLEEWKLHGTNLHPPAVIAADTTRNFETRVQPQFRIGDKRQSDSIFDKISIKPMFKPQHRNKSPGFKTQQRNQVIANPIGINHGQSKTSSANTANLHQTAGLRPAPSFLSDVLKLLESNSLVDMSKMLNGQSTGVAASTAIEPRVAGSGIDRAALPLMPAVMLQKASTSSGKHFQPRIVVPAIIHERADRRPAFSGHLFNTFDVSDRTRNEFKTAGFSTNMANSGMINTPEATTRATLKPVPFKMPETKQANPVVRWIDLKDLGFLVS